MTLTVLKPEAATEPAGNISVDRSHRDRIGEALSGNLGATYVLMVKAQAVHWNVTGPLFKPVHDLTEDQYRDLFEIADVLAERLRALGLKAPMTYAELETASHIQPFGSERLTTGEMIETLASDHETAARGFSETAKLAGDARDIATEDLATARVAAHEKHAWMLRAMLADA